MNIRFKSALEQINAEAELINNTEKFLKSKLNKKNANKVSIFGLSIARSSFAATVATMLLTFGGSSAAYAYYKTPVSYLCVDINPSVELGINIFSKVVAVHSYNSDGELILKDIKVTGSSVKDAVRAIVISASKHGYIAEDGSTIIELTSETKSSSTAEVLSVSAETGANDALTKEASVAVVENDNISLKSRATAKELGITPGKLNLIKKLMEVDPEATVEAYKDASVKTIMKKIKDIKSADKATNKDSNTANNKANNTNSGDATDTYSNSTVSPTVTATPSPENNLYTSVPVSSKGTGKPVKTPEAVPSSQKTTKPTSTAKINKNNKVIPENKGTTNSKNK